jgi:o-succinylbenzoate synthase
MFNVSVFRYEIPYTSTSGSVSLREGYILRMQDSNGAEGFGEIAPLPGFSKEAMDECLTQIKEAIEAGEDAELEYFPSVSFGVESAYLSLLASRKKCDINQIIHPLSPISVPVNALLFGDKTQVLAQLKRAQDKGYTCFKLKVGQKSYLKDVDVVNQVVDILGDASLLRLDANRKWELETALAFAKAMENIPVEYIEEPVEHPKHLLAFSESCDMPIAIDETIQDMNNLPFIGLPHIHAVIIKPTLIGGTQRCLEIAQDALANDKKVIFTSSFESGLGHLIIGHLASSIAPDTPHGLSTLDYLNDDIFGSPMQIEGGRLQLRKSFSDLRLDDLELIIK